MNIPLQLTALALAIAATLGIAAPVGAADTESSTTSTTASTTTLSPGQSKVIGRTADTFTPFAGSRSNAESMAIGLRTGSDITLTGTDANGQVTTTTFTPPTRPMGHGNVSKAMALSSQELAAAGVAQPTPDQIKAAMMGGNITNDGGQQVQMQGVLQMRADGMGWGQIAHNLGVKPGQGFRPAHTASGVTTAASTTSPGVVSAKGKQAGTTTAGAEKQSKTMTAGSQRSGSGIVTATGGSAPTVSKGASHRAEASTTAGGQSGGVVNAGGKGHGVVSAGGQGSGVVSAGGQGSGVVSAAGGAASGSQGRGGGLAKGHSK